MSLHTCNQHSGNKGATWLHLQEVSGNAQHPLFTKTTRKETNESRCDEWWCPSYVPTKFISLISISPIWHYVDQEVRKVQQTKKKSISLDRFCILLIFTCKLCSEFPRLTQLQNGRMYLTYKNSVSFFTTFSLPWEMGIWFCSVSSKWQLHTRTKTGKRCRCSTKKGQYVNTLWPVEWLKCPDRLLNSTWLEEAWGELAFVCNPRVGEIWSLRKVNTQWGSPAICVPLFTKSVIHRVNWSSRWRFSVLNTNKSANRSLV